MGKPHKHAELIKAFADNPDIEIQGRFSEDFEWNHVSASCLIIEPNSQYRIKPKEKQTVVRWKWVYKGIDYYHETEAFYSEYEIYSMPSRKNWIKLEYTRTEFPE